MQLKTNIRSDYGVEQTFLCLRVYMCPVGIPLTVVLVTAEWCPLSGRAHAQNDVAFIVCMHNNSTATNINPFNPADQSNYFANSVDPDRTAHYESSYQDLHCLPF